MKNVISKFFAVAATAIILATPMAATAENVPVTGSFTGENEHITTGGVQVIKTADGGAVVILDSDFSLDGAPDPRVGFGTDGVYADASDLGELQNISGLQIYVVPPTIDVDDFNEIYIWCLQFNVSLGVASLG